MDLSCYLDPTHPKKEIKEDRTLSGMKIVRKEVDAQ